VTVGLKLDLRGGAGVETSGTWKNQVDSGLDATIPNSVAYNAAEKAFELRGGSSDVISVSLPTNPSAMPAVTYSLWVKLLDSKGSYGWVMSQSPDYGWSRSITLTDSRTGGLGLTPGGVSTDFGNAPVGKWIHVVAIWTAHNGPCEIFVNGVKKEKQCTNGKKRQFFLRGAQHRRAQSIRQQVQRPCNGL